MVGKRSPATKTSRRAKSSRLTRLDDSDEVEQEKTVKVSGQYELQAARKVIELSNKNNKEAEIEAMKDQLQAYRDQLFQIAQQDIAEYTHLNILNRLLQETKEDYIQNGIPPEVMIETFENLAGQILEAANRRLERIPIGFGSIMGIINNRNDGESQEVVGASQV